MYERCTILRHENRSKENSDTCCVWAEICIYPFFSGKVRLFNLSFMNLPFPNARMSSANGINLTISIPKNGCSKNYSACGFRQDNIMASCGLNAKTFSRHFPTCINITYKYVSTSQTLIEMSERNRKI